MSQVGVAISILIIAGLLMLLGYNLPKTRMLFMSIGFFTLMSGAFANYSNWLPQTRGEVPEETKMEGDISKLPVEKLSEMGEAIIFGKVGGFDERGIGKGQCPLCHSFKAGDIGDRAPNLIGIGNRAAERVKEPAYLKPTTVQTEAFAGSGRATTAAEYIAESHSCPSCYVVADFGVKGSNDRESPMPQIHKPPIGLSLDELIAVDTWMFFREGLTPPPYDEIRKAYEKFIPEKDRIIATQVAGSGPAAGGLDATKIALPDDSPIQIITKMGCAACHRIPTIDFAKVGVIGPLLIEGTNAARRIASPEYKAAKKAGTAHATTPKEYIIESIMNPSAFIVSGFPTQPGGKSLMPPDFANKFTYAAVSQLADFLLSLDVNVAIKENLDRSPFEKEGSLHKKAEQDLGTAVKAEVLAQKE
ncbi:MAG: nitric oxide reductase [Nitrospira sp.]|nr:nitric oxide reductase [Nitrospira sp.]